MCSSVASPCMPHRDGSRQRYHPGCAGPAAICRIAAVPGCHEGLGGGEEVVVIGSSGMKYLLYYAPTADAFENYLQHGNRRCSGTAE